MKVIFDFDDVIFNTKEFKSGLVHTARHTMGVGFTRSR